MSCPFCRPEVQGEALWESEHYLMLADAFPGCTGHVLLITREHLPSHMHAPAAWMAEFEAAQDLVRRFLRECFGSAGFWENGGMRQEVEHAHVHGLPFAARVPPEWEAEGWVTRIGGWADAQRECERTGSYTYLETPEGLYLVHRCEEVLNVVRPQLVDQSDAREELRTDSRARAGAGTVAETVRRWREWAREL